MTGINAKVECVLDGRDKLGEGIFWCPLERALYWVDVPMPSFLHRWDPKSGKHNAWPMPEMITSLAKRRRRHAARRLASWPQRVRPTQGDVHAYRRPRGRPAGESGK